MKKEEIYVPVTNKEQAEQYRKVLEAMGEPISPIFWNGFNPSIKSHVNLCFCLKGNWTMGAVGYGDKITFGQLIDLLSTPAKIAVKVDNEKEFNALMKYYDSLGWKWCGGMNPLYYLENGDVNTENFPFCIQYNDLFKWNLREDKYQIIPFTDFAKDKGIKVPLLVSEDGVELFKGDEFWHVCVGNNSSSLGHYNPIKLNGLVGTPYNEQGKFFSTKQAAIDWIESQKPKEVTVKLTNHIEALINKNGLVKFNAPVFRMGKLDIEAIYKTMNEL